MHAVARPPFAIIVRALCAHCMCSRGRFRLFLAGLACTLSACSSLQPPARPLVYDFGPGARTPGMAATATLPPLALAAVQAASALDTTAVLYRLAYADVQQLRPYALARWSMPPADLLRQRLREQLGRQRPVLTPAEGLLVATPGLTLRIELDEFTQVFDTPEHSVGLLRLRATAGLAAVGGGEQLLAQRSFVVQHPSPSPDAAGGARALAAAVEVASAEIAQWLQDLLPDAAASPSTR